MHSQDHRVPRHRAAVRVKDLSGAGANPLVRQVVAVFRDLSGLAGVSGRDGVVQITYPELAEILGAVPASVIPEDLLGSYADVMRWLRSQPGP